MGRCQANLVMAAELVLSFGLYDVMAAAAVREGPPAFPGVLGCGMGVEMVTSVAQDKRLKS